MSEQSNNLTYSAVYQREQGWQFHFGVLTWQSPAVIYLDLCVEAGHLLVQKHPGDKIRVVALFKGEPLSS